MCVSPSVLFALSVFPVKKSQLLALDILQRKMLRRIVGWRRLPDESWRDTMVRMNTRLQHASSLYYCESWMSKFARGQWRYVHHLLRGPLHLWARVLCKYNWSPHFDPWYDADPHRRQGHPNMRWDDHIHRFCHVKWPHLRDRHWFDILVHQVMHALEAEYANFICESA